MGQTKIRTDQVVSLNDGWIPVLDSYNIGSDAVGLDVIEIDGDATGYLSAGMRIKVTQDATVYYGIVHYVTYSIPDSDTKIGIFLSVSSGTRNRLNGNAVSAMYYSREKIPYGFPADIASFSILVDNISGAQASPDSGWYNVSSITTPLGKWRMGYKAILYVQSSGAQAGQYVTLSTVNNAESDSSLTGACITVSTFHIGTCTIDFNFNFTSETTYYLNIKRTSSTVSYISIGGYGDSYIYAQDAYL